MKRRLTVFSSVKSKPSNPCYGFPDNAHLLVDYMSRGAWGERLGSILDGMREHNFKGNGSFFRLKRMDRMNTFSFKMGFILA